MIIVKVSNFVDATSARLSAMKLAKGSGFSKSQQTKIGISVSELATNIVKYAGSGEIKIEIISDNNEVCLVVYAEDNGPGIHNIENAFKDNWSDSKYLLDDNYLNHDGRGAGLPAVKRLMDHIEIASNNQGTLVKAVKYLRSH